jgi:antibiotic biosynthesis monooxygenase (ABM) superfamily enzyme
MPKTAPQTQPEAAQAVLTLQVAPGREAEFAAVEGRLGAAAQLFAGFLGSEISRPVAGVQDNWAVRVQFDSPERLAAWLESDVRRGLLEEMAPLLEGQLEEKAVTASRAAPAGVTVLLHTQPKAGSEREYARWQEQINAAAAGFPGFQEARVFPAHPPYQAEWAVAYSFDNPAHLQSWIESKERREWLERGQPLFEQTSERHLAGGFANWFSPQLGGGLTPPPGWKQVMATLLALYPTVMLLSLTLGPVLDGLRLPLAAAMFFSDLASCTLLQYLVMSWVNRGFGFWLAPDPATRERANLVGTAVVLGCYAVFVAIFLAVTR